MSNGSRSAESHDLDAIVKDIAALKKDIGLLMEHVKDSATKTVGGETRRIYSALSAEGEKSVAALSRQVEDRPLSSLLIAFGIGFIGAQLLKR
ncbi:MAG TPA: hypothetical protein VJR47_16805 [Stellaceae bacterium]|nr:hypothetical protein [Stellaceae bacterium]